VNDFILGAEARHLPAREVGPVVGDDGMRKLEATYDILPEELDICCPGTSERETASTHFVK